MSDTYQAIYDAARGKMSNGDIGEAVYSAINGLDLGHYAEQVSAEFIEASEEHCRPSVLYRPQLTIDGNQYCALYGENLQDGIAGFGDSPNAAMRDFDKAWNKKLTTAQEPSPNLGEAMGMSGVLSDLDSLSALKKNPTGRE